MKHHQLGDALEKLAGSFEGFAEELRDLYDGDEEVKAAPARNGIDDDTDITMKSGDLRHVIDAYRKMVRWAREGKIPTQEQRVKLHQSVRKVKHLIRKPVN